MSQEVNVLSLLKASPNPSVEDLVNCPDIIQIFKSGNQQLLDIFLTTNGIKELIHLLQNTNQFQVARRILQLFTMRDSPLLHELINSFEHTEDLVSIFDKIQIIHSYTIGAITQILFTALDSYPGDFYECLNNSRTIIPKIVKNIEYTSVYYLCTQIVITSIEAQTFCWFLFISLMGDHGPGCAVPKAFAYDPATSIPPIHLNPAMRKKILELLFSFLYEFPDTCDFYNDISVALPLILQDASDDYERSLVFKLGLRLNINEAIAYSAQSVLNCLKSSDLLIQYALYYIYSFGIIIRSSSVELILYRLLHRQPNNFVLNLLAKMIQSIIEGDSTSDHDNSDLTETLQMIIADAFQDKDVSSTILRAFRACLFLSAEGNDVDAEGTQIVDQINEFNKDPHIMEVDHDYIQQLKNNAETITKSQTFMPVYNVSKLWKPDTYKKMAEKFKSLGTAQQSPPQASQSDEPRPDLPKQERSPAKMKYTPLVLPNSRVSTVQKTVPLPANDLEEEDSYSDGYYEEESDDEEEMKLRAIIESQKAAKLQAEAESNENTFYDNGVTTLPPSPTKPEPSPFSSPDVPQSEDAIPPQPFSYNKSSSILNLPAIPPAPKPVDKKLITPNASAAQTASKASKKGKGKAAKKGKAKKAKGKAKSAQTKPVLNFTMNVGVVDAPPQKTNSVFTISQPVSSRPLQLAKSELELNISSLKLKPRKEKPVFDKKVLVIDCPLQKPVLSITETNSFELELDDMKLFSYNPSPRKKLSSEEIRKMLSETNIDAEVDYDIEPLPSELEEEDIAEKKKPVRPIFVRNPFARPGMANYDDDYFEEEEEEQQQQTDQQQKTEQTEQQNQENNEKEQQNPATTAENANNSTAAQQNNITDAEKSNNNNNIQNVEPPQAPSS